MSFFTCILNWLLELVYTRPNCVPFTVISVYYFQLFYLFLHGICRKQPPRLRRYSPNAELGVN